MLLPRIIPSLLIHKKGLVKTLKFKEPKYVGDPINAVKIFNEKEVDELFIIDIDASVSNSCPDYKMIENLATECRMPLCYGGGVKTIDQAIKIFSLGVEKVAIGSSGVENPDFINRLSKRVGSQSVVLVLDIKKKKFSNKYEILTHNGKKKTNLDPVSYALEMQKAGVGEIVINSIDFDGVMKGYDLPIIRKLKKVLNIPLTVLGGAGKIEDLGAVIKENGIIGVAAGSFFVFKGKYNAVLISYPTKLEKEELFKNYFYPYWNN